MASSRNRKDKAVLEPSKAGSKAWPALAAAGAHIFRNGILHLLTSPDYCIMTPGEPAAQHTRQRNILHAVRGAHVRTSASCAAPHASGWWKGYHEAPGHALTAQAGPSVGQAV